MILSACVVNERHVMVLYRAKTCLLTDTRYCILGSIGGISNTGSGIRTTQKTQLSLRTTAVQGSAVRRKQG